MEKDLSRYVFILLFGITKSFLTARTYRPRVLPVTQKIKKFTMGPDHLELSRNQEKYVKYNSIMHWQPEKLG